MAINIKDLQTFTAADLLKLCEHNIAMIHAGGQAKGMGGRNLTQADLSSLYEERRRLQEEVAASTSDAPLGMVSVQFNDPN